MFEYRDKANWLIGAIATKSSINWFDESNEASFNSLLGLVEQLSPEDFGLKIEIINLKSRNILIEFILSIINEVNQRNFTLIANEKYSIVTEKSQIFWLELAKGGVNQTELFKVDLTQSVQNKASGVLPNQLLIATNNPGKAKEFKALFEPKGIEIKTLSDFPELPIVEETGMTFEENARLKAETITELTGLPVLADDSGIMVDVLGGMPGVFSARFSGEPTTDQRNNAKLLHELATQPAERRGAKFHSTLALAHPDKETLIVEADWLGQIAAIPKGENGFGYDPLFLVGNTGKTAAELTEDEKNRISHRAKALEKLSATWEAWWQA